MSKAFVKFQIGKEGITSGVLQSLRLAFKTHKIVRISALKSSGRDREKIKEMAEYLAKNLGGFYDFRIIGFTIVLHRYQAKPKR